MQVKKSNLNYEKKKISLKSLGNSYKALMDYHTRKRLDEYLNKTNNLDVFHNPFINLDNNETKLDVFYNPIDNMIGNMENNFFNMTTDFSEKGPAFRTLKNLPKISKLLREY